MKDYTQYKLNLEKSPIDERDWLYSNFITALSFPNTLDLRDKMFDVRDQGSQGSCAAMSGAAMKDWQEKVDVNIDEYMSPQFIYNNRDRPGLPGMNMRDLMKILKDLGTCRESSWPYGNLSKPDQHAYDEARNYDVSGYASIDIIDELKQALSDNGPCVIAVPVYNYTGRMWYQRAGEGYKGGHAMTVVGYTEEGFIIRNSWGDNWNGDGHTIFPYTDWGLQWELWSTVDAESQVVPPIPPIEDESSTWWIWVVAGLVVAAGVAAFFIF